MPPRRVQAPDERAEDGSSALDGEAADIVPEEHVAAAPDINGMFAQLMARLDRVELAQQRGPDLVDAAGTGEAAAAGSPRGSAASGGSGYQQPAQRQVPECLQVHRRRLPSASDHGAAGQGTAESAASARN